MGSLANNTAVKNNISEEQLVMIEHLAGCNYSPKQIATFLKIPERDFLSLWRVLQSSVRLAYERGKLISQYEIAKTQQQSAIAGNITAAQVFLKESKELENKNILNQILFDDDY
ncbi:hypothetical protein [Flavobacterium sp. NKUCC04_CG]|uniref:hypothetical protein n=1 Tax=Flavobacterium sp. NKUCC04_CG TaxID=2842121 RepID=UPI001C5BE4A4|nr:hypothetical protein [Flavobacterium sp. NKUCC04_CG]MBW3519507.1 hypothetical protein [Flavobacterium sp. NKUCC04_CG]